MSLTGFNLMRRKRAAAKAAQESPAVDYDSMKIEDLKAAAKDAGIEGAASMKKADLLKALKGEAAE